MKCILGGISGFAVRPVVFSAPENFGHCSSLSHFILAWIVLFEAPHCMGMAMRKGI